MPIRSQPRSAPCPTCRTPFLFFSFVSQLFIISLVLSHISLSSFYLSIYLSSMYPTEKEQEKCRDDAGLDVARAALSLSASLPLPLSLPLSLNI